MRSLSLPAFTMALPLAAVLLTSCSEDSESDQTTSTSTSTSSTSGSGEGGAGGSGGSSSSSGTGAGGCDGPLSTSPSFEDTFDPDWEDTQTSWRRASWTQNGTQMSPDRCVTSDDGLLEQTVLAGEPYRGGSMQSTAEYRYGRWVARLKPSSVPGVLNSMFTMDWDDMTTTEEDGDGTHQEIDIEFLTYTFGSGTGQVHFAVHAPPETNYFVADVDLDFNPSDDFHEWGFDILPDRIEWHVDGQVLATFTYDSTVTITGFYEMFFNSWTAESWINGPPTSDAVYQVDWVRFYPYDEACADG